ncbi:(d)CMP kinase [Ornithinibacillus sp. 4-3]|uniref:Cytidylate kinase n=1 Tax=Ornithinibacillus sp. 4-3 TaxID=3231488 RepID=A0AB39HQP5_9BACI
MNSKLTIAIDGPAAAGKSTVSKIVATKLGYIYIDTGAMYRAITLKAINENIHYDNEDKLTAVLLETSIELKQSNTGQKVFLDGKDVSLEIRSEKVTHAVSQIAKHSKIREIMVEKQKAFAKQGGVVMDGRDIGTHVLPNAELKFFLIASAEERAKRRHQENIERGFTSDLENIKNEIIERDLQDTKRKVAPLIKAEDAIEVDTTSMSIDDVASFILDKVNNYS